jgi:hypothetical protein
MTGAPHSDPDTGWRCEYEAVPDSGLVLRNISHDSYRLARDIRVVVAPPSSAVITYCPCAEEFSLCPYKNGLFDSSGLSAEMGEEQAPPSRPTRRWCNLVSPFAYSVRGGAGECDRLHVGNGRAKLPPQYLLLTQGLPLCSIMIA